MVFCAIGCTGPSDRSDPSGNDDSTEACEDGLHTADVSYFNPDTGHRSSYSVEVEIEDGRVTVIHFSNGGYLDRSRLTSEPLEEGEATVVDDRGREYQLQVSCT